METRNSSKLSKEEKVIKLLNTINDLNIRIITATFRYKQRYKEILIKKLFDLYNKNMEILKECHICESSFEKFIGIIIKKSNELLNDINNDKRLISKSIRKTLNLCIEYRKNKMLLLNGLVCDDLITKIYEYVY
jgi:hypothetical protein